jgi:uncharacterized protein CbrC (UPF0167 family)
MELPRFRYHPQPLSSGSLQASAERCDCCGQSRGYIYAGPVYAERDPEPKICPWCIAGGAAHKRFAATFVDDAAFPGHIPEAARREIAERTPGYAAWQSERWPACCGDAAAFLSPAGARELREGGAEAEALRTAIEELELQPAQAGRLIASLDRDRGPTAYIFQCLHCGRLLVNIDHA